MTSLLTRNFVDTESFLFIPNSDNYGGEWLGLESLVWDGPPDMMKLASLKHTYGQLLGPDSDQMALLSRFFRQTLSVRAATWGQITDELRFLRTRPDCCSLDCLYGLYQYLSRLNIIAFADDVR